MKGLIVLAVALLILAGCGNNRGRQEWDSVRDAVNRPFK